MSSALRDLPSVDRLAAQLAAEGVAHADAVAAARRTVAERRAELVAGATDTPDLVSRARAHARPSLRRVINATGVVIHTNLGRAVLAEAAADAVAGAARGSQNLELDLATGTRGDRSTHVRELLCELTGAEDALVVNNGAAAVLLAAAAIGGPGSALIVSRGQLVEIGGGFRIPDVVAQAGARLVEVGTTNRTRLSDYRDAVAREERAVVMRVHPSNFRAVGFVQDVPLADLCRLGAPVIDDVGSGAMLSHPALDGEPDVRASVAAGATVVCFSGDKLLGGPQAGILVGLRDAINGCARHPLARAVRIGRLPLAGLEATLRLYRDPARAVAEIPVLRALDVGDEVLIRRAERLAELCGGEVVESLAKVGGGALPLLSLPGPAVALPDQSPEGLAEALRCGEPPVVARIASGRVQLDVRTIGDDEIETLAQCLAAARLSSS